MHLNTVQSPRAEKKEIALVTLSDGHYKCPVGNQSSTKPISLPASSKSLRFRERAVRQRKLRLRKLKKPMRLLLSMFCLSVSINTVIADEKSILPEMIASSIENNYSQVKCFAAKYSIEQVDMLAKEQQANGKESKGSGATDELSDSKINLFATFFLSGENFREILEFKDGVVLNSRTKNGDTFYDYVPPRDNKKNGIVWKKNLTHMGGTRGNDPRVLGLEEIYETYPQVLRTNKVLYIKKTNDQSQKTDIYDVCLERPNGNRWLISFDSSINYLPVKIGSTIDKEYFNRVTKLTYEEKKPGVWLPKKISEKTVFEKFKNLDDLNKESVKTMFVTTTTLVEFKLEECEGLSKIIAPESFPVGTEIRDSITNTIYIVGEKQFEKQDKLGGDFKYSKALWWLVGLVGFGLLTYVVSVRLFKRRL